MPTVYAAYGDRNFFENIKGKVDFLAKRLEEILSKLKITMEILDFGEDSVVSK